MAAKDVENYLEIDQNEIDEVIAETLEPLSRTEGENPAKVVEDLREMMLGKNRGHPVLIRI